MWTPKEVQLGKIQSNKKINLEFRYDGIIGIKSVTASCGCAKPIIMSVDNQIKMRVIFTPQPLSKQTIAAGRDHYRTTKTILVTYADNKEDIILIKGEVYDRLDTEEV